LAAIGAVQLDQLDEFMSRRRVLAGRYAEMLADVPGILAPTTPGDRVSAWQTYAVTVAEPLERDAIAVALRASGIGCNIGTYALHRQEVYGPAVSDCPVSDRLFRRHLALPMYSDLTDADQDRVVETLAKIVYQQ
jgi:perosamine synthetase